MKTENGMETDQELDEGDWKCEGEEVLVVMNSGMIDLIVAADAVKSWTAYTLHDDSIDNGDFRVVADEDGEVIGVECPDCGLSLLFEHVFYNDEVWNTGWNTYLQCDDSETIVFVTDKAREMFGIPEPE
jgi:hypothetical protein